MGQYIIQRLTDKSKINSDNEDVWVNEPELYYTMDKAVSKAKSRIEKGSYNANIIRVVEVVATFDSKIVVDVNRCNIISKEME